MRVRNRIEKGIGSIIVIIGSIKLGLDVGDDDGNIIIVIVELKYDSFVSVIIVIIYEFYVKFF